MAEIKTNVSPRPIETPLYEIKNKPINASSTANHWILITCLRSIIKEIKGVKTRYRPVIKPVFETVVFVSPKVWKI